MSSEEVKDVLAAYGADPEVLREYGCIVLRARIVRDAIKIRTPAGSRTFKKVYMSDQRLSYVHQLTEHVAFGGHQSVPRFIRTRYGDPYVEHPSGLYYMTAWFQGRDADLRKPNELFGVVRVLGRWHQAAQGFSPSDGWEPEMAPLRERIQTSLRELRQVVTEAKAARPPSPFQRLLLASESEIVERTELALAEMRELNLEALDDTARAKGYMCHGSIQRQNVVFNGDGYALLHYDNAHPASPLHDVASLLHRYLPTQDWRSEILREAVDRYASVWPLLSDDRAALAALLAPPLRTLQTVLWYARGAREWDEEDYVDYLESCLEQEEAREQARWTLIERGHSFVPVALMQSNGDAEPDGSAQMNDADITFADKPMSVAVDDATLAGMNVTPTAPGEMTHEADGSTQAAQKSSGRRRASTSNRRPRKPRTSSESSSKPGKPTAFDGGVASDVSGLNMLQSRKKRAARSTKPSDTTLRGTNEHRSEDDEQEQENQ